MAVPQCSQSSGSRLRGPAPARRGCRALGTLAQRHRERLAWFGVALTVASSPTAWVRVFFICSVDCIVTQFGNYRASEGN